MKKLFLTLHFSLLIALFTACGGGLPGLSEPKADVSSPATYSHKGLEFQYPGNWTEGEEMDMFGVLQAGAESSGSAIAIVHKFPAIAADDISTYAKDFGEGIKEAIPVGNVSAFNRGAVRKQGEYESIQMDFSISLMGETVPHQCNIYRKVVGSDVLFIVAQAATEDLPNAQPGFDLIRKTLKYQAP